MKYINKKLIDKKKFFPFKINKYFFLFLLIFFLGIWTERFDFKYKIINFSKDITNTLSSRIFSSFSKSEKIILNLNYENYSKILSSRQISIKSMRASEDIHKWVNGNLIYNDDKYDIKLKLKGVHSEHWEDPKKWSFKIKLLNDKSIDGIKRFSIQQPKTRDYLYEWLFMKVLEEEGLIFHRTKFLEASINGESLGLYFLEEQHSKQLIENNKRREGPIIGLDKNLWINEANNVHNLIINTMQDSFWRAKIKPVQFNDEKIGTEQELYLKNAIGLFEEFRKNNNKLNETFDSLQLAKLMAIKAIFGSSEFDWRDVKFYYNPITSLLEPIGREVHISKNFGNMNAWWVNNYDTSVKTNDQISFLNLLYSDKNFFKLYLSELYRLSDKDYINQIILKNKIEFEKNNKLLKANFPLNHVFSTEHMEKVRNIIRNTLNPIQGVNAYFIEYKDNQFIFSIQNTQHLPVKLNKLILNDGTTISLNYEKIISGKKNRQPVKNNLIKFSCNQLKKKDLCKNNLDEKNYLKQNTKITYNILGQTIEIESNILKFYKVDETLTKKKLSFNLNQLNNLKYLKINAEKNEIYFNNESLIIKERLLIPSGFKIFLKAGTEIIFQEDGQIISYSPFFIDGEENNPVKIIADVKKIDGLNKYGNGFSILNAKSQSVIKNTHFINLKSPSLSSGEGLLGGINIYRSDIIFKNCKFIGNQGEDFLNLISSEFQIKNVFMENINFDAIDFDFSKGKIENITIIKVGNDALDFSGSEVTAKNIFIDGAGDKGISAGEKSIINLNDLKIKNSNIGIASKDLSKVSATNITISNANIVAAAYQKKVEYGPGLIDIKNINQSNNSNTYLAEKNSVIKVNKDIIDNTNINYSEF